MWVIARRGAGESKEGADGDHGRGEQHQGQSDLNADEEMVGGASRHASGNAARASLHGVAHIGPGEAKRRGETKQNSGDQGNEDAKGQRGKADLNGGFMRESIFGQKAADEGQQVIAEPGSKRGAGHRQQQRFRKELAHDATAGSANGRAEGELMLAGGSAGQQENGDVGTSDGKKKGNGSEENG